MSGFMTVYLGRDREIRHWRVKERGRELEGLKRARERKTLVCTISKMRLSFAWAQLNCSASSSHLHSQSVSLRLSHVLASSCARLVGLLALIFVSLLLPPPPHVAVLCRSRCSTAMLPLPPPNGGGLGDSFFPAELSMSKPYTLPDGTRITLGRERYRAAEPLFEPAMQLRQEQSLQDTVLDCEKKGWRGGWGGQDIYASRGGGGGRFFMRGGGLGNICMLRGGAGVGSL